MMISNNLININKCVGCGGCKYICPQNAINLIYERKKGFFLPYINKDVCIRCGLCTKICPSTFEKRSTEYNQYIGKYEKIYLAHSTDPKVRHYSSSGGVVNTIIRFLIDKKIVDGVLLAHYDKTSSVETSASLITSKNVSRLKDEPREYASRYVIVPVLSKLDLIDSNKKYAVVGTPCQIIALEKIQQFKKLQLIKIGVTCSGGLSYNASLEYKRKKKMTSSKMYYRGDGWPGKNTLIFGDKEISYHHKGSLFERMFSSQIFKNKACRNCTDHFAEMSDVSFCDFWNADEQLKEKEGNSCVIIRNEQLLSIYNGMEQAKYINTVRELKEQELINSQYHVLKVKKNKKKSILLRLFYTIIDIIRLLKLYKLFSIRIYNFLCRIYAKICYKLKL